ncbi:MAG: type II secretion system minor pseudopilin GspK [Proteobacteria bacterium]|nr:type II secretion system minor pseudopilin GspK [Pseudomonadota bacterium]
MRRRLHARPPHRATRGAALVLAMLLAALAAAVVVGLATGQERWRAGVEQRRDQVQATALAQAAVQWARQVLAEDAQAGPVDSLNEPWAFPLPRVPLDNGSIEGRIVDLQGLVNLNNLGSRESTAIDERRRIAAVFASLGLPAATLDAVSAAVATDPDVRNDDAWYAAARPPRMAPRRPLTRLAEFADVRGIDAAQLPALAAVATALPPVTTLNVNTAPPAVLAAALPGLEGERLDAFIAQRTRRPFTSLADLRARLPPSITLPDERTLGVASGYFLATVIARQGATEVRARALIRRDVGKPPVVAWQVIE